ncbi:lipid-transfer protein [Chloroflexota bacterium]
MEVRPSPEAYLIRDKAAIVGIGATEFSRSSGRSELQLACEAIKAAVEDAGLKMEDIDGIEKYTADRATIPSLVSCLGIPNLTYYGESTHGGGATNATALHAATAVVTGVAKYVVCFRALNESSGPRFGRAPGADEMTPTTPSVQYGYFQPFGLMTPSSWVAMVTRRYMHEYGATSEQLGWVAVVCREHAQKNPNAILYGRPITLQDHQESQMIVDPLRRLDCCLDADGAIAYVVTTAERARDLKQRPAYILGASQGIATDGEWMTSFYRPIISGLPEVWYMGQELFRVAGVTPKDFDVVEFYDAFTPLVPMQLEELGFCGRGEGAAFCEGGDRIRIGGELPINTAGGALAEAYIHGLQLIAEGVRQIRGTSTNQVKDAELVLVTGGLGVPTSGLILRR